MIPHTACPSTSAAHDERCGRFHSKGSRPPSRLELPDQPPPIIRPSLPLREVQAGARNGTLVRPRPILPKAAAGRIIAMIRSCLLPEADVISAGGDTDSNGAILGSWLGASYTAQPVFRRAQIDRIHEGPFGPDSSPSPGGMLGTSSRRRIRPCAELLPGRRIGS